MADCEVTRGKETKRTGTQTNIRQNKKTCYNNIIMSLCSMSQALGHDDICGIGDIATPILAMATKLCWAISFTLRPLYLLGDHPGTGCIGAWRWDKFCIFPGILVSNKTRRVICLILNSWQGATICLFLSIAFRSKYHFSPSSRPAFGPTQSLFQRVPENLSRTMKRQ